MAGREPRTALPGHVNMSPPGRYVTDRLAHVQPQRPAAAHGGNGGRARRGGTVTR